MKKGIEQLLVLCVLVGMSIFFVGNTSAAESQTSSIGRLLVPGSIGKIEDGLNMSPELGNELLDIRVLIPKEQAGAFPQTGAIVPTRFIMVLGMVLVLVSLSYFVKQKRENGNT